MYFNSFHTLFHRIIMAAPVGYTKLPEPSAGHQNAADISSNGLARVLLKIGSPLGMTAFSFDTPLSSTRGWNSVNRHNSVHLRHSPE